MKILSLIIAVLLGAVVLADAKAKKEDPGLLVVTLVDVSASATRSEDVRSNYVDAFNRMLSEMTHGDSMFAALISEKSISEQRFPIKEEFPPFNPTTDNDLLLRAQRNRADEELKGKKEKILNGLTGLLSQGRSSTDIMGAIYTAGKIFERSPEREKILVLLSDMIEESDRYNFRKDGLSDSRIKQIINKEKIPNLKGVKVFVVGAKAPSRDRFERIESFWTAFFKHGNADLQSSNYMPACPASFDFRK